jgi:hypothetical protein
MKDWRDKFITKKFSRRFGRDVHALAQRNGEMLLVEIEITG